jgi:hypothetical protein
LQHPGDALALIVAALGAPSLFSGGVDGGKEQADQNAYNRDDDQ